MLPLLLALALLGTPAQAADGRVATTVFAPVLSVQPVENGAVVTLAMGANDGVVLGGRGTVYRQQDGLLTIGVAVVEKVDPDTAVARVTLDPSSGVGELAAGDIVDVPALVPKDLVDDVTFQLARLGIAFDDGTEDHQPLYTFRGLLESPAANHDGPFLNRAVAIQKGFAEYAMDLDIPAGPASWRYAGSDKVGEAMLASEPEDMRDFLLFVSGFPGKYAGKTWEIAEVYATWVLNGAPTSPGEIELRYLALPADQREEYLAEVMPYIREYTLTEQFYSHAWELGDAERYDEALAVSGLLEAAVRDLGDGHEKAMAFSLRGTLLRDTGDVDGAMKAFVASRDVARRAKHADDEAVALNNIAGLHQKAGRWEEAIAASEQAIRVRLSDPAASARKTSIGHSWWTIAACREQLEQYEASAEAWRKAIDLYAQGSDLGSMENEAGALVQLGKILNKLGRYRESIEAYERSLALARSLGWDESVATSLDSVADGWEALGDRTKALEAKQQVLETRRRLGQKESEAAVLGDMGDIAWDLGRSGDATRWYEEALAIYTSLGRPADGAWLLASQGAQQRDRGDHETALTLFRRELELLSAAEASDRAAVEWEIAYTLQQQRKYEEADAAYERALGLAVAAGGKSQEADIRSGYAQSLLWQKRRADARTQYELALELRRGVADKPGELRSLLDLAWWYSGQPDFPKAREYGQKALEMARAMPSKPDEVAALRTLGNVAASEGDLDRALELQRAALAVATEIGDVDGIAQAELAIGDALERRGRGEEAFACYDRALKVAIDADRQDLVAQSKQSIAWLRATQGRYDEAMTAAKEALDVFAAVNNDWGRANALNTIAGIQHDRGDFGASIATYQESLAIRRDWNDPWGIAGSLNNMAGVYRDAGDCERALPLFEEAVEIGKRIGYVDVLTVTVGNIAACQSDLGRKDEALASAKESLRVAEHYQLPPRIAGAWGLLGRIHRERGELAEAEAALTKAEAMAEEVGLPLTALGARKQMGLVAFDRGDLDEARRELAAAAEEARTYRTPTGLWETWLYLARARAKSGDREAAIDAYEEAIRVLEQLGGSMDAAGRASFGADHQDAYRELATLLSEQGRNDSAFDVLERMKAAELREAVRPGEGAARTEAELAAVEEGASIQARQRELERLVGSELAKPARDRRTELVAQWQAELDELALKFQEYSRSLGKDFPDLAKRLQVQPASFFQIREDLLPNEAFLEPVILPDRVVLFLVRPGEAPLVYHETMVDQAHVDQLVRDMRDALAKPHAAWGAERGVKVSSGRKGGDPSAPAKELYELLVAPIRPQLEGIDTLVVSPSGRLRYLPFAALYDGERFLVEDYRLAVLTQSGAMGEHDPVPRGARLLAYGNPDGSLPGAESEVEQLTKSWKKSKVKVYKREEATKARLRGEVSDVRIVHLATHGVLTADSPESSYILLAGEGDDAKLTFREIPLLPLEDVSLAVLSACETALGENGEGAEIAGLAYQFEMRGAASVVASLWAVSDAGTTELMGAFYEALSQPQTAKAEALREAQLRLLSDPELRHPYYWAPFVLVGDWR